ncbi:MAG: ECF transporter S component [Bacilli bacterium]|jgi:uncharacterized membrane protein|nr:ECF transporter S component [Bacilli bacterium]MCH4210878.1 ECF transporter S component [Bacilli bacterium]MCH4228394.1 ECF transporter S component [Bacilli bacterium]MCH4277919.1 ECF transporter S component [Bacilli bacterium]MCI2054893.1 ECF transporter S component [Bacilli bacterium]
MSTQTIVFWILLVLWVLSFLYGYKKSFPSSIKTKDIAVNAIFFAIILVMGFVPQVGYITIIPGLSLTLLHIPVLIGSYLYGWKKGALLGLLFGVTSWIEALLNPTGFNAFFIYPWVSILPRVLFGILSGLFFQLLRKTPKIYANGLAVGGISFLLTCLHTVLVFLDLFVFYPSELSALFIGGSSLVNGVTFTFLAVIALGMLGEATLSALVVPSVGRGLQRLI